MENNGVKCDVCECVHNCSCEKCDLGKIEITHNTTKNAVDTPHFCKSFEEK